jgi:thiamine biosynthesis protein ThiS
MEGVGCRAGVVRRSDSVNGGAMEIRVNGELRQWDRFLTVHDLLEALGVRPEGVVVERNLTIVPRERMAEEPVEDGDSIEIIRLVRWVNERSREREIRGRPLPVTCGGFRREVELDVLMRWSAAGRRSSAQEGKSHGISSG